MTDLELITETTCQICGVICDDAVCEDCGQTPETTPLSSILRGARTAPAESLEPLDQGLTATRILTQPGGDGL